MSIAPEPRDLASEVANQIPPNAPTGRREPGIGLALSGGGYRAMLFHLGGLLRLSETALLSEVSRVSSVSGGAIAAAALAQRWDEVGNVTDDRWMLGLRDDLHGLASRTIDVSCVCAGLLPGLSAARCLVSRFQRHLVGDATLQDLPDYPRFTFNTTNFVSGAVARWSKDYVADYKTGTVFSPRVGLAEIVAASSAFPPFLSPLRLQVPGTLVDHDTREPISPQPDLLVLTDGGVYDNYGLEPLKKFHTVLVSDGGAPFDHRAQAPRNWLSQSLRTTAIINSQARALRAKQLVESLDRRRRLGALWTITTPIGRYPARNKLPVDASRAAVLAQTATRLKALRPRLQKELVNLGYAQADAAIRSYVDARFPEPGDWPYPEAPLG